MKRIKVKALEALTSGKNQNPESLHRPRANTMQSVGTHAMDPADPTDFGFPDDFTLYS